MIVMEERFPAHPERGNSGRSARKKGPSKEELRIRLQLAPFSLTKKETEITLLLLEGLKRDEILENCEITNNTLKTHIRQIYRKLSVTGRGDIPEKIGLA